MVKKDNFYEETEGVLDKFSKYHKEVLLEYFNPLIREKRNEYKILVGKPQGKRPLRRPRSRWEENVRMDHREGGYERCGLGASDLGKDTLF
jgi:hypothetical protein